MSRLTKFGRFMIAVSMLASAAGCQHGVSSGAQYVPASTFATIDGSHWSAKKIKITSSCPKLVIIGGGLTHDCTFQEAGYSGKFYITENTNDDYMFTVSPTKGTKKTVFVIQTYDSGGGYYVVRDKNGNEIVRDVRVAS